MTILPKFTHAPILRLLSTGVVCLASLLVLPAFAQDDNAMSVEEFVKRKDQWPRLQGTGTSLTIEGRRLGGGPERLVFANCDLLFQFAEGVHPPNSKTNAIQVTGSIEARQGKQ